MAHKFTVFCLTLTARATFPDAVGSCCFLAKSSKINPLWATCFIVSQPLGAALGSIRLFSQSTRDLDKGQRPSRGRGGRDGRQRRKKGDVSVNQ